MSLGFFGIKTNLKFLITKTIIYGRYNGSFPQNLLKYKGFNNENCCLICELRRKDVNESIKTQRKFVL